MYSCLNKLFIGIFKTYLHFAKERASYVALNLLDDEASHSGGISDYFSRMIKG